MVDATYVSATASTWNLRPLSPFDALRTTLATTKPMPMVTSANWMLVSPTKTAYPTPHASATSPPCTSALPNDDADCDSVRGAETPSLQRSHSRNFCRVQYSRPRGRLHWLQGIEGPTPAPPLLPEEEA